MAKKEVSERCELYFPSDIQEMMGIGKTKTYEFLEDVYLNQSPFTVFKVGKLYRIPKASFNRWYYADICKVRKQAG